MISEKATHVNSSRSNLIGASLDITRNGKPPPVTPTGYTHLRDCKAIRSQLRAWARIALQPKIGIVTSANLRRHCSHLYSGTKSLVPSFWVCPTHLKLAHTVQAHALYGWWYGRPAVRQLKHTYWPGRVSGRATCTACSAQC